MYQCDFLVIGSGIAGLSFAWRAASNHPGKKVVIITKAGADENNTRYAQGGVAVVMDAVGDSFEQHIEDTLRAGDGLCKRDIVEMVVKEGPERLREIISLGAKFDKSPDGSFALGMEGAHSARRILHHKDTTGQEILTTLLEKVKSFPNVEILGHHFAVDLITRHYLGEEVDGRRQDIRCFGAYVLDIQAHKTKTFLAKITVLASGGIGQVYRLGTNPLIATGDGIAMAYRAKALLEHMEFVQFHPTALYTTGPGIPFLISEAIRGFGAILKTQNSCSFMEAVDERGSLASRDIVARAIDAEIKSGGGSSVFLDCRHLDKAAFAKEFPTIYRKCQAIGIDIARDMIPVAPAAHYLCGGVKTDEWGHTNIQHLYCCGEVASTGLHGANRLASNSLLEALVFSHRCHEHATGEIEDLPYPENIAEWEPGGSGNPNAEIQICRNRSEVKDIMSDYAGIVRSHERLRRAMRRLKALHWETEKLYDLTKLSPQLCELRNMVNVAWLIVSQSLRRMENKGTFYNEDIKN